MGSWHLRMINQELLSNQLCPVFMSVGSFKGRRRDGLCSDFRSTCSTFEYVCRLESRELDTSWILYLNPNSVVFTVTALDACFYFKRDIHPQRI
jgi:hypothetical protein